MAFYELAGSPTFKLSASGNSCQRRFAVDWGDLSTFCGNIATGGSGGIPKGTAGLLSGLVCSEMNVKPLSEDYAPALTSISDPATSVNTYSAYALVEATYTPDYFSDTWTRHGITKPSCRTGTTLKLRRRFSGQFLQYPARATKTYVSPGDPPKPPQPADSKHGFILIPLLEYQVEWDAVSAFPSGTVLQNVGSVNDGVFMGAEAGTLLFEGCDQDESFKMGLGDQRCTKATFVFKCRRIVSGGSVYGWNHDFDDVTKSWKEIRLADGNPRYRQATFTNLFA